MSASIQSGGTYVLINAQSHTALDLSGGDKRSITGWELNNGDNQKWEFYQEQDGKWTIKSKGSDLFLGIEHGREHGNYTPVVPVPHPFHWDIFHDEKDDSLFRIFVHGTTFNIDLSDKGNAADGTPVHLWTKWSGRNQCWELKPAS
ncbi:carbohydrate-binding module family 13 protein [Hygrophoropsis aurantiaca]|uniref:Carbohydrate-binding module family 13 protein n=1 Tax=Hygrophoropsis aurantiaca TaxID=72124 RepID=A0ACB8ABJ1_9AGAM|nr:carbohydrate-binding module family 13 protein [Hygrophoropsis aurantiaca]